MICIWPSRCDKIIYMYNVYNFTYIGSLSWNYISGKIPTDVSYISLKNIVKLHIQSNN